MRIRSVLVGLTTAGLPIAGFFSLFLLFADPPPGGATRQFMMAFAAPAVAGLLFGLALGRPRYAPVAALAGWGPFLLFVPSYLIGIANGEFSGSHAVLGLGAGPALVAVVAAVLGGWIARWLAPQSAGRDVSHP